MTSRTSVYIVLLLSFASCSSFENGKSRQTAEYNGLKVDIESRKFVKEGDLYDINVIYRNESDSTIEFISPFSCPYIWDPSFSDANFADDAEIHFGCAGATPESISLDPGRKIEGNVKLVISGLAKGNYQLSNKVLQEKLSPIQIRPLNQLSGNSIDIKPITFTVR